MSEIIQDKFKAMCLGAGIGEAIGMPSEGMKPREVLSELGEIKGYIDRPERDDFLRLEKGHSARQTEALLSVLAASNPLPDLQEFAFLLKQALNQYPEKWPKSTTFAWPPFPDGGHYTFAFAIPVARQLNEGKVTRDSLAKWLQSLTPSSVVWQQSIWLYIRLLDYLFPLAPDDFEPDEFLSNAAKYIREAEVHFPGDYKIRRRMQVTEPMMEEPLELIAASCGGVSKLAEDMITFVGAVFCRYYKDYKKALTGAASIGGSSEASGFYLGSLMGALGGMEVLPEKWLEEYKDRERVEKAVNHFENKK